MEARSGDVERGIRLAVEMLESSEYLVAFTGAGISADSGVPTFRGRGGLWERYNPEDVATPEAFKRDPLRVWEWYVMRMRAMREAKPNLAHLLLAELESRGLLKAVITQNVDGLHRRAGSRNVVELHGNVWRVRCSNAACEYSASLSEPPSELPPLCPKCGNPLRPAVVWFGEPIPAHTWARAVLEAETADTMLVIGTSAVVMPAGMLPLLVKRNGGRIIEVNPEETRISSIADVVLRLRAVEFARRVAAIMGLRLTKGTT